jgi:hypothetical protein
VRVRVAIPDKHLDAPTIEALLEATTRAATRQIRAGEAPDIRAAIQRGYKWKPEPFLDGEHFDLPALASRRGWGDCDDNGPWGAASLRASGEDPNARARAVRSGPNSWHVVTELGDGRVVDFSRAAGMRSRVSGPGAGVHAGAARPMALKGDGAIACKRDAHGVWWCRCDLPWGDAHVASYCPGRGPEGAVRGAVQSAIWASDGGSAPHRKYAYQLADWLLAHPTERARKVFSGRASRASIVGSLLAGEGTLAPYGSEWMQSDAYERAVASRPGSEAWWTDPLVTRLWADDFKFGGLPQITSQGSNVAPVISAVDWLGGFHGGQWSAVSRSIEALASALDSTGKYDVDRAHILDAIGYPVSSLYDARVAAERGTSPRIRIPKGAVRMTLPGGASMQTPARGGSIIVRF